MREPEWARQVGLSCEYCGAPAHLIPIPKPMSMVASDQLDAGPSFTTAVSCPEHRFLVGQRHERLDDEHRFAERKHGRPALDDETYPEQMRRSLGRIMRRLGGWDGPDDGR